MKYELYHMANAIITRPNITRVYMQHQCDQGVTIRGWTTYDTQYLPSLARASYEVSFVRCNVTVLHCIYDVAVMGRNANNRFILHSFSCCYKKQNALFDCPFYKFVFNVCWLPCLYRKVCSTRDLFKLPNVEYEFWYLTHRCWVAHICNFGSVNGLPNQREAIIWGKVDILSIGFYETYFEPHSYCIELLMSPPGNALNCRCRGSPNNFRELEWLVENRS